jgi:hypothetical protein
MVFIIFMIFIILFWYMCIKHFDHIQLFLHLPSPPSPSLFPHSPPAGSHPKQLPILHSLLFLFLMVVLRFEVRALHLWGRHSTTWTTLPVPFYTYVIHFCRSRLCIWKWTCDICLSPTGYFIQYNYFQFYLFSWKSHTSTLYGES